MKNTKQRWRKGDGGSNLLFLCAIFIVVLSGCNTAENVSSESWLFSQSGDITHLSTVLTYFDEVTAFYITDTISSEDYQNEIRVIYHEVAVIQQSYAESKPEITDDHYASTMGISAYESVLLKLKSMLETIFSSSADKEAVVRVYTDSYDALLEEYATIIVALSIIEEVRPN